MGTQKLEPGKYLPRFCDAMVREKLSYTGAVEIRGPKWCGKTQSALQLASSAVMMQDPDKRDDYRLLVQTKPSVLLRGETPRLIDEWQEQPQLWDAVRYAVDQSDQPGRFILTGSATPTQRPSHSGTGRIASVEMSPMSLAESGESTREVSLSALFSGNFDVQGYSGCDVERMAYLVCRGGWPRAVTSPSDAGSLEMAYDYLSAIADEDISRTDGIRRNPQYARLIMQEYARCTSTQAAQATMLKDLKIRDIDLSKDTVNGYIAALRRLYVVRDLPSWAPSLRSRSRITKTPTRHFTCPSIAAAALGASPASLLRDTSTLDLLFESLCARDMRVYAQALKGEVFHYRDEAGQEADLVLQLRDGRYALLEVKLGASLVDEGAASLIKLAGKIDTSVMGSPAFCAVITPGGFAQRRQDGVFVLPITCLSA